MAPTRTPPPVWTYALYSVLVVAMTLFVVYVRDPSAEHVKWVDFLILPGALIAMPLCPGCWHSTNPYLELLVSILNVLAYLAVPLIIMRIVRWRRGMKTPGSPSQ